MKRARGDSSCPQRKYLPELPTAVIDTILNFLDGDTATLCAAACLNTAWRGAACRPHRWRNICLLGRKRWQCTDASLACCVRRAGTELLSVVMKRCKALTDTGLLVLRHAPPELEEEEVVLSQCYGLSLPGVSDALTGRVGGRLSRLHVTGRGWRVRKSGRPRFLRRREA